MSVHEYAGGTLGNGDLRIVRDDGITTRWDDADFQAWLAQQTAAVQQVFQLSAAQAQILQAKALDFAGFVTFVTNQYAALTPAQAAPPQKVMRLWYELMQRALKGEIV